jgi:hypothetical protein
MGKGIYYLRKSLNDFLKIINFSFDITNTCYIFCLKRKNNEKYFFFPRYAFSHFFKFKLMRNK